jgi:hypothetical protein
LPDIEEAIQRLNAQVELLEAIWIWALATGRVVPGASTRINVLASA